jgi:hypothetical protein
MPGRDGTRNTSMWIAAVAAISLVILIVLAWRSKVDQ